MIKFSVFLSDDDSIEEGVNSILKYAREHQLYVWKIDHEHKGTFTHPYKETMDVVHGYLVSHRELGHMLHEQKIEEDDIPF